MAHTKKKIPYRIRFRGAEYVLADVDVNQVRVPKALKDYINKRFRPIQNAMDESLGLVGEVDRALNTAYFRKTGIRDLIDLKQEALLDKKEIWERIATFNAYLAKALGKTEVLQRYLAASADIAAQYDILDPQLFDMEVEKAKEAAKDLRPVAPDKELEKSFKELINLSEARERLKKLDDEEQEG